MVVGFLVPFAVAALVVFVLRSARSRRASLTTGQQVRYFFHYAILSAALIVTAIGATGTLGRLFDRSSLVAADASQTALDLAMVLVGAPLTAVMAMTTRRRLAVDKGELASFGWALFVTVATVVPLVTSMFGGYRLLSFVFGVERYDGYAVSQTIVWLATWYVVRRVDRSTASGEPGFRHTVCALIGLGVAAVGLAQVASAIAQQLIDLTASEQFVLVASRTERALALFVVGGLVWLVYWVREVDRRPESDSWRFIVVIFGVGGGLVAAIVSVATVTYLLAVWLVGSPGSATAREHFDAIPDSIGTAFAGMLTWWYHRTLLIVRQSGRRTEIDRVYEYVMAAGGLVSTSVGAVLIVVGMVDAITGSRIIRGDTATNSLLLALILLAIGGPVWLSYWRGAARYCRDGEPDERTSVSRRVYVVTLLGVGGLVALGSAIASLYVVLRDLIDGRLGESTLRDVRYPVALLLVALGVAWEHLGPYRELHGAPAERRRRQIVLAGPPDPELEAAIASLSDVDVEWVHTTEGRWNHDEVLSRLAASRDDTMVVATSRGARFAAL